MRAVLTITPFTGLDVRVKLIHPAIALNNRVAVDLPHCALTARMTNHLCTGTGSNLAERRSCTDQSVLTLTWTSRQARPRDLSALSSDPTASGALAFFFLFGQDVCC